MIADYLTIKRTLAGLGSATGQIAPAAPRSKM
jgi:hypothetical protein